MTELELLQNINDVVFVGLLFITASSGLISGWFISGRV